MLEHSFPITFIIKIYTIFPILGDGSIIYFMGIFKIAAIILTPVCGMTYLSFSLGRELPKACRWFGNYVGLSYIYFKSILKTLKPEN